MRWSIRSDPTSLGVLLDANPVESVRIALAMDMIGSIKETCTDVVLAYCPYCPLTPQKGSYPVTTVKTGEVVGINKSPVLTRVLR